MPRAEAAVLSGTSPTAPQSQLDKSMAATVEIEDSSFRLFWRVEWRFRVIVVDFFYVRDFRG